MLPIRLRDLVQTVSETLRLKLAHDDKSIQERLKKEHGDIIRIQSHEAPDWFGDGWLVSFEVPKHASEEMPIIRAAFFRNDNGKPVFGEGHCREGWLWELHRPLMDTSRLGAQPSNSPGSRRGGSVSVARFAAGKRRVGKVDQTANLDG